MTALPHPLRLAACLSAALALSPPANAAVRTVINCNDAGAGSLRAAVASAAATGDTVVFDTGQMGCSTITLTSGQIVVDAQEIVVQGPGAGLLTINGNNGVTASRIFFDSVDGPGGYSRKLTIGGLTIANGFGYGSSASDTVRGGCILASGDVTLSGTVVTGCTVTNSGGQAAGGAIWASSLHMDSSTISGNDVFAVQDSATIGGGAYVRGQVTIRSSTISNNRTHGQQAVTGPGVGGGLASFGAAAGDVQIAFSTITGNSADFGGGIYLANGTPVRTITIDHSTIAGNQAYLSAGAIHLSDHSSNATTRILDSTISGNTSSYFIGGVYNYGALTVSNSSIVFNSAQSSLDNPAASGLFTTAATLQSTLIAKNTDYGQPADLGGDASMLGSKNLIMATLAGTTAPPGTLTADPLLGALANNGGPTQTRALLNGSPAIGTGNNLAHLASDQRGPGFARSTAGKTDIGAFQTGDGIFYGGFD